jgi:hypothetical protein
VTPCSLAEDYQCFGGAYCDLLQDRRVSESRQDPALCLLLFSWLNFRRLKIEEERASDPSVNFYQMTRCHILYDSIHERDYFENLKTKSRVFWQRKFDTDTGGGTPLVWSEAELKG